MTLDLSLQQINETSLPSANEIAEEIPFSLEEQRKVFNFRQTINHILEKKDPRLLLIIGPCSIHCVDQAIHYAEALKGLTSQISDLFFPVMRVYYEKPRSSLGWQGLVNDPHLDSTYDIVQGIRSTRQLLKNITALGIPCATEFVNPLICPYFEEMISWGSIGARTATSQIHRQLASSLPMPMGIKNDVFGQVSAALQALTVSSQPQTYVGLNAHGQACIKKSKGNPHVHLVLRGGETGANYHADHISQTMTALRHLSLPQRVIIDCGHGNSGKEHREQSKVFHAVLDQRLNGNRHIVGMMLESNLEEGNQPHPNNLFTSRWGVSVTDACLSWNQTVELLEEAVHRLKDGCCSIL